MNNISEKYIVIGLKNTKVSSKDVLLAVSILRANEFLSLNWNYFEYSLLRFKTEVLEILTFLYVAMKIKLIDDQL